MRNVNKKLEYLKDRIQADQRLSAFHASLLAALIFASENSGLTHPFQVSRSKLMRSSKIYSTSTYHKCINELQVFGYISYSPSYNPFLGSEVSWKLQNDGVFL
ncbi:hypothetical protein EZ449_02775 [Pedobacter frigidisoli]|uniref:Helix-turn-helix domain-containing protein n=1 Tax=Pedobacter frigidisoli TaxID=2530455 RepID=A0A4R0PAN5_9SPHI|nr:hypothetical protein EZ449_02775 [Pedobacter frigidisoli]